jgi:4-aminobutyrate aminotransferase
MLPTLAASATTTSVWHPSTEVDHCASRRCRIAARPVNLSAEKSEGDVNFTAARSAWQDAELDARTRELLAADARYFLQQSLSTPCLNALSACEGTELTDLQGRRLLDFHGNSVHQVGFAHPAVIDAIKQQLDSLSFCTRRYTNDTAVRFAQKLVEITPAGLDKVLLAPGGTSAIGMALKLARIATGRHKTISMWDSFHGASLDAISIGGEAVFRSGIGPLLPGAEHVPPADEYRCLWDCASRGGCDLKCAQYIEYVLEKEGDVAAVIAEPIRSTPYIPSPDYWRRVRAACDRHGALLIFDEICQGLGRTGKMFACEHFGVVPDVLVLGKGLGGGILPLAAIVAKSSLDVAGDRALGHYTHEKNPVLCAAGLATAGDRARARSCDQGARDRRSRTGDVSRVVERLELQAHDGQHHHALAAADDHARRDGPGDRHS